MDLSVLWQQPYQNFPILVLLLPLFGFIVLSLFGERIKRDGESSGAGYLACGTVIASFLLAAFSVRCLLGLGIKQDHLRFVLPVISRPSLHSVWISMALHYVRR